MRTLVQKPKATQGAMSERATIPVRNHFAPGRQVNSIQYQQRTLGNQAEQRLRETTNLGQGKGDFTKPEMARFGHNFSRTPLHAAAPAAAQRLAGDQPGEEADLALGGEPDSSAAAPQPMAGAVGGDATSISTSDLSAAEWMTNGQFKWWIKWVTDGASGWIVQKIENTYSGTLADGSAVTNASVGVTPLYYEAWEVASNGSITGSLGATGNRDRWERPNLGALGSQTNFSMLGTVYWTAKDPAKSGFTSGGVSNAGSLLSSTSAPAGIGSALLARSAFGQWHADGTQAWPGCTAS